MKSLLLPAIAFVTLFSSCNKQAVDDSATAAARSGNNALSSSAYNAVEGTYTLTLQPGPSDGDDLWMKNWIKHSAYADTCDTEVGLIKGLVSSLQNSLIYTRSVIKFDGLASIPANAAVVSATLYLYGPSPKSKDVKQHLPTGNSSYPGSTKGDNTCLLQRITSDWNKNTISWNNPPVTTTVDQFVMPASNKQWQYDVAMDVTTLIKPMVSGPNYGFLLRLKTEEKPRFMGFLSADSPETTRRPKLVVVYSL